jgi:hypothetical protein
MKLASSFVKGRMNKSVDERLLPQGEYVDAMNIRLGSTEESEIGAIENAKGNEALTSLTYNNVALSSEAICLGSIDDSENETIYWFVHDPNNSQSTTTRKVDMVVSYNTSSNALINHVISTDDGGGVNTALNFSETYRVNGVSIIENLLFFTDNNNQPMRINVDRTYNEPSVADLLVIVKPPSESPVVQLLNVPGQENYMDTRFISFAYRYKYRDGEYSAVSQFSEIAFDPKPFSLSVDTYQNEGMVNEFNSANVSFNTGGDKVVGIDLLFKLSNQSVINVIEKFDKQDLGWGDNQTQTINFTNRKIYTTLGSSEILRLFDNVPRKAQAQTIMGNRLMYGNYVDGYDVKDSNGEDCLINYDTKLIETIIDDTILPITFSNASISLDPANPFYSVSNGVVEIDCTEIASQLFEGSQFDFSIRVRHNSFTGGGFPTTTQPDYNVSMSVVLTQDYANISNFIQSTEFKNALEGVTIPTNLTQCGTINQGVSLTDSYNCTIQPPLDSTPINWNRDGSGVVAVGTPITAVNPLGTDIIEVTLIAMRFVDAAVPGSYLYEYFEAASSTATFNNVSNKQSLHSDRDYEVGIVYMDDYNRSTTALVSINNTVFVPPGASITKNTIEVTIPTTQKPPSWATRYKFVIKPSSSDYETIYSDLFFIDPADQSTYIKLEGDNQTKANEGDRLRVKRDTDGALSQRIETVVLELEAKEGDFIADNQDPDGNDISEPGGLYMKVKPNGYNTQYDPTTFLGGEIITRKTNQAWWDSPTNARLCYPVYYANPNYDSGIPIGVGNTPYIPWEIPANSRVIISFTLDRKGRGSGCEQLTYTFDKEFVASTDYESLYDFVIGENIDFSTGEEIAGTVPISFDSSLSVLNASGCYTVGLGSVISFQGGKDSGEFNPSTNPLAGQQFFRLVTPFTGCSGLPVRQAKASARIRVFTSENVLIFETLPIESDANIYYEGSDSYAITNGNHMSGGKTNDVNQDIAGGIDGVVNLSLFNCFTFGNGAESYKIRDGLTTPSFRLGERTTAVSEQDFKEAHRFADITYSGIYNEDTNVNRLNEFNLGQINFKELQKSFGPIRVLSSRASDILTLQEDKISYVLSSKNLLSDSVGGGAIASIPEVLGTQIARIEEYGISNNPESFVQWGYDKYFTDAKRGAVIQLTGQDRSEKLTVISEAGMRGWFRDYFILTPNKQKLGGYDPYMNEYVLSGNLTSLPQLPTTLECGTPYQVYTSDPTTPWTVKLGEEVGLVTIDWSVKSVAIGESVTVNVTYNGVVYTDVRTSPGTSSFTFDKNLSGVTEADVSVVVSGGFADFTVNVGCPSTTLLNVIKVCVNTASEAGKYIHNDYYWTQGTYVSPTSSDLVFMQAQDNLPLTFSISQYNQLSGPSGRGIIPAIPSGATPVTLRIQSTKRGFDDFEFDPATHNLKYLLSTTLYNNTPADINTMLAAATTLTPLQNPITGVYYYDINYVQFTPFRPYLYLIYDYS